MDIMRKRSKILALLIKKQYYIDGLGIAVVGRRVIAKELKISASATYRCLKWLERERLIKSYSKKGCKSLFLIRAKKIIEETGKSDRFI